MCLSPSLFNALNLIACPPMTCSITFHPISLELPPSFVATQDRKKTSIPKLSSLRMYNSDISLFFPSIPGMSRPFYYISSFEHFFPPPQST